MIIDFHTHLFDPDVVKNREKYFDDSTFSLLYSGEKSKLIDYNMLTEAMNASEIDYFVAMGFPWKLDKYCEIQNKYFRDIKALSSGRIIPFGSVPLNDIHRIDNCVAGIKELGLAGIGEIAFYNDGLSEENADVLREVFWSAQKHSLPVCLHVSEPVGNDYTGKHTTEFSILYSVLKKFPDVISILSHWGGGLLFYELNNKVNASLKNVYYDTAASPYLYNDDIYEIAIKIIGSKRILFGTDFPLINYRRYFDSINNSITNDNDRKNICGRNAARILNL